MALLAISNANPVGIITQFYPPAERMLGQAAQDVIGIHTPPRLHDPEEMRGHALQLTRELGHSVATGFATSTARADARAVDNREWGYVRQDGSRLKVPLSIAAMRGA